MKYHLHYIVTARSVFRDEAVSFKHQKTCCDLFRESAALIKIRAFNSGNTPKSTYLLLSTPRRVQPNENEHPGQDAYRGICDLEQGCNRTRK
jgi:hypothetical protein